MPVARRISTIFLAGALVVPLLIPVHARAAKPDRKAQKKALRQAQAQQQQPARPTAMLERLKEQILALELTADQKRQVEELFAKARDELAAGRKDAAGEKNPAKFREKAQATVRELRQKVMSLLSEEQRQDLRQRLQTVQAVAVSGGEQLATRVREALMSIELSDEQKQKLDAVLADSQRKARELTQRTQGEMRDLLQQTRAKVEALLTPEQRQKLHPSRPQAKPPREGAAQQPKPKADTPDDRL